MNLQRPHLSGRPSCCVSHLREEKEPRPIPHPCEAPRAPMNPNDHAAKECLAEELVLRILSAATRFPMSVRSSIRATRPRARTHTAPSRIIQNWTLPSPGGGAGRCAGCARGRAARGGGVPRLAGAGVSVGSTGAGWIIGTGRGWNRSPGTRLPGSSAAATRADIEKPSTAR